MQIAENAEAYPEDFKIPVDHDAPGHFETAMVERHVMMLPPDSEDLVATQRLLDATHPALVGFDPARAAAVPEAEIPSLVAMGGIAYINDGHHRILGARLAGVPIQVEVWSDPEEWD